MTEINKVGEVLPSLTQRREDVVFRAVKNAEVIRSIKDSTSRIEAIRQVRLILSKQFPEVASIPEEEFDPEGNIVGGRLKNLFGRNPSAEFLIARDIVELLRD